MIKPLTSQGYSTTVAGWLVIGDAWHELAKTGPTSCTVRSEFTATDVEASLVIDVDGNRRETKVRIIPEKSHKQIVHFAAI
jgi:hypothetical protein